ncbi:hypothetical protein BU16DRAFT_565306 [Lophium mytilinum]|uniref:Uncharacterized protein n=1 Tax=Lophium mytilinum TaxID=390894 RepID=A0A6A6QJJ4_9PEZI|nr:hypothetical protein BU16DRAFT_565306 [Lophium mytilinum]
MDFLDLCFPAFNIALEITTFLAFWALALAILIGILCICLLITLYPVIVRKIDDDDTEGIGVFVGCLCVVLFCAHLFGTILYAVPPVGQKEVLSLRMAIVKSAVTAGAMIGICFGVVWVAAVLVSVVMGLIGLVRGRPVPFGPRRCTAKKWACRKGRWERYERRKSV